MKHKHEIRLAGTGGQGVILATVILAEAAVLSGHYAAQSQTYGPEARGGSSKAETLISNRPIGFTKVQHPTCLVAFTQKALDKYSDGLSRNCLVILDAGLKVPEGMNPLRVISLPIVETAKMVVGKIQTANIVTVGCINEFLGISDQDKLEQAVLKHIPKGTEGMNMKALEEGIRLAQNWKEKHRS